MALGGEWIMSIKPIVDSIQFILEIVIIAIFIVRIYVKKKKRISVKKYNRVIIICVICWLVLGISMEIVSFSTLEAAMAFQGEDISGAKVVYGEDSALVARVKDGTIVFDAFLQEHGKWIVQHTCKMKMGDKKEMTDKYKFKPDEKQFLYYGV